MFVTGYRCLLCGAEYEFDSTLYACPQHGAVGTLDVCYDYDAIKGATNRTALTQSDERSMWRYLPFLPVPSDAPRPPLSVGWTPLYAAPRLGNTVGISDLWVKDEGRNPTGSLKDRASAVAVVRAQQLGYEAVTTASTGNAAAALAGLAASVGLRSVIFVPKSAPEAKIAQLMVYGAEVFLVDGSYDDAFELCLVAAERRGWYCRNTGYNPLMGEGKKTVAHEICEQLNWQVPDVILVGVGDGSIIGGVHKGLVDLMAVGWIDRMPRLLGVQAEHSDALTQAWEAGSHELPRIQASTRADSISADYPRDGYKALRAVRESGGAFLRVSDGACLAAIPELARGCGVFAEPAAAATWAGLKVARERGLVQPGERVLLIATGSGLKDVGAAIASTGRPRIISKEISALEAMLSQA